MSKADRIKLKNYSTSHLLEDVLHKKSKPIACTPQYCTGSFMAGQSVENDDLKTKEGRLKQAAEFLEQYYGSLKMENLNSVVGKRVAELGSEMDKTGTFMLNNQELQFGVKTAWRNAPRCIARRDWNILALKTAFHVTNTQQMFEVICDHIEKGTNGGVLKPIITLFPPRIDGREDFRVWNQQFFGFAGYIQQDGTTIGDPGQIEFTRVCKRLGWKGAGTRFDLLPIVLSAPDEGAKFYEIPEELVMLVDIVHPNFAGSKELGLKWYVMPAVTNMLLDIGGLEFPAAPFNGWYMCTEIARNFCDTQRYNLCEEVAKKVGRNVSNMSTLWKDQIILDMNVAILHSFRQKGVTIMDHHTASDSFIRHLAMEQKDRGGCPADWVWIVPPISGSATSVFHQEMLNYNLKPSLEYQVSAWKTYDWGASTVKVKHSLKTLAKATALGARLMGKANEIRKKVTIVFATETGRAEGMAQSLKSLMRHSFNVELKCMTDYKLEELENETFLLIVASTYGNGEAPENGKEFESYMERILHHTEDNESLCHLKYAVFALGSSQYLQFCGFGKLLDKTFKKMGAIQLEPIELGDELKGQMEVFNEWAHKIYLKSCKVFDAKVVENQSIVSEKPKAYDPDGIRISWIKSAPKKDVIKELSHINQKPNLFGCHLLSRHRLQPEYSSRQTLMVRLSCSKEYEPGDHLGIYPSNPPEIVQALITHLQQSSEKIEDGGIQLETLVSEEWQAFPKFTGCTVRMVLTNLVNITSPPSPYFLAQLVSMTKVKSESEKLNKLATDTKCYDSWRSYYFPTMADLLQEFPGLQMDVKFLLTNLPLMQPRYYSISSSPRVNPEEVHLTLSLVDYKTQDGKGPQHFGVCTGYLDIVKPKSDTLACFLRTAPGFRLPQDPATPVIMIAAGSGIAPFRSFWQEREMQFDDGTQCGSMVMFFGCRQKDVDYLYGDKLKYLERKGVLTKAVLALSREEGQTKRYVQDEVISHEELLLGLLEQEGAHIYVCGDSNMAQGVRKAVDHILTSRAECSVGVGAKRLPFLENLQSLVADRRYHEDIFGAIHRN